MELDQLWYVGSVVLWGITYLECIRVGFKQKTFAMPFWALALNITWELLASFYYFRDFGIIPDTIGSIAVLILDAIILFTYLKWGIKYWPANVHKKWFLPYSVLVLIIALGAEYTMIRVMGFVQGSAYAAFIQNLLMSILFFNFLIQRNSAEGQNMLIAVTKCIGTLLPTLHAGVVGIPVGSPNLLIFWLGFGCFVFDLLYILALYNVQNKGKNKTGIARLFELLK